MRRPQQWAPRPPLTDRERRELASGATYEGSGEHKVGRWWGGLPRARQMSGGRVGRRDKQRTTVCPLTADEDRRRATGWVREAIVAGQYRFVQSDKRFPRNVWFEADGVIWFGFCFNSEAGQYKGWPISEEERDEIFGGLDR